MVERRGEFAVRGGILDVFPPTDDHPLRIEFWGDQVEEIRWFAVADQRSLEVADGRPVGAAVPRDPAHRRRPGQGRRRWWTGCPGRRTCSRSSPTGIAVEGMESLAPVLVDRMVPVLDLVGDDALVVVADPERVRRRAHDLIATTQEFLDAAWTAAAAGAKHADRPAGGVVRRATRTPASWRLTARSGLVDAERVHAHVTPADGVPDDEAPAADRRHGFDGAARATPGRLARGAPRGTSTATTETSRGGGRPARSSSATAGGWCW